MANLWPSKECLRSPCQILDTKKLKTELTHFDKNLKKNKHRQFLGQ